MRLNRRTAVLAVISVVVIIVVVILNNNQVSAPGETSNATSEAANACSMRLVNTSSEICRDVDGEASVSFLCSSLSSVSKGF